VRHGPIAPPYDQGFAPLDALADLSDLAAMERIARRLPVKVVWIESPAERTSMTAAALRRLRGEADTTATVESAFVEQDFGDWHGRRYDAVYGVLSPDELRVPALVRPPGGETFEEVASRVAPAIEALNAAHKGVDFVAVAHAGTIRAALTLAMDLAPRQAISFVIDILSVTRLDRHQDPAEPPQWSVVSVNNEA